ncbi:hypothetical protein ACWIUD_08645 [Helicobacter sp. 23-1044]
MEVLQRFKAFARYIWDYKVEISFYAESKIAESPLNFAESSTKYTHPLTPSAREGESFCKSYLSAREGEIFKIPPPQQQNSSLESQSFLAELALNVWRHRYKN